MKIVGLQKTTLLDYPGHVAATIFLGGCNFRCPFCHNMNLVETMPEEEYTEEQILKFLKKRAGVLDGVCITGGEPSLNKELPDFIRKIKAVEKPENKTGIDNNSLLVKLDTNGTNPEMLKLLIDERLIDYVAMDIKTSPDEYGTVAGIDGETDIIVKKVRESINTLILAGNSGFEYEFRTTVINEYHNEEVMKETGKLIKGAKRYFLQSFKDSEYVINHSLTPPSKDLLEAYRELLLDYVECVDIRGVD